MMLQPVRGGNEQSTSHTKVASTPSTTATLTSVANSPKLNTHRQQPDRLAAPPKSFIKR